MGSVYPSWLDLRPEDDAERFTERSEERRQLFEHAKSLGRHTALHPVVWAFLQVADLEIVKSYVDNYREWVGLVGDPLGPSYFELRAKDVVRLWKQEPSDKGKMPGGAILAHSASPLPSRPATPTQISNTRSKSRVGGREYSPSRSEMVARLCKERDGNRCVVSRLSGVSNSTTPSGRVRLLY